MIVISLGGSRIIPKDIDVDFLLELRKVILRKISSSPKEKIAIVCGGGFLARMYQNSLRTILSNSITKESTRKKSDNITLDKVGILATKMNAFLVKSMFSGIKNVKVYSGTVPGHSTDFVATTIASKHKSSSVINFSNIKYVYDKDPRLHKDARKIERISYAEFEKQFGKEWIPGKNVPFDPKALSLAKKKRIKIFFSDSVSDLEELFSGKSSGTIIE